MKTSISKYTAQKIERLLNELLTEDEFDSLLVEIKSSEYMGDVKERECVDISWLDYKKKGDAILFSLSFIVSWPRKKKILTRDGCFTWRIPTLSSR